MNTEPKVTVKRNGEVYVTETVGLPGPRFGQSYDRLIGVVGKMDPWQVPTSETLWQAQRGYAGRNGERRGNFPSRQAAIEWLLSR